MEFLIVVFFLVAVPIIALFAFPKFSPIPYFPSNRLDLDLIVQSLGLKHNQTIVDLGAGDGIVIFAAAQKALERNLNTRFVAIELNPLLYLLLRYKRFRHPNKNHISIVRGDIFSLNYKKALPKVKSQLVFYIYVSPWLIKKLIETLHTFYKEFYIISYMYKVEGKRPTQTLSGKHKIFRYLYV